MDASDRIMDPIMHMNTHHSLNFENTRVAFTSKSDRELRHAEWLFRLIGKTWLTNLAKPVTTFLLRIGFPITPLLRHTVFAQFCGGETIAECQPIVEDLYDKGGVYSILDYSIEGKDTEAFFDHTLKELLHVNQYAGSSPEVPFLVFKPSGMGRHALYEKVSSKRSLTPEETEEWSRVLSRFDRICAAVAATPAMKIMVDAEESWIQPAIDRLTEDLMIRYNQKRAVVLNTVQMYRHDRLPYLKHLYRVGRDNKIRIGIKLVRGAYMEKERERAMQMGYDSPICPDKRATDINFDQGMLYCLSRLEVFDVFAGSHNENSCRKLGMKLEELGIAKDDPRIWFGQLYGMSDHISFNLAETGHNTAKYVPYGPIREVVPYLFRRAEENSSVGSQSSRELYFIKKERLRRKRVRALKRSS